MFNQQVQSHEETTMTNLYTWFLGYLCTSVCVTTLDRYLFHCACTVQLHSCSVVTHKKKGLWGIWEEVAYDCHRLCYRILPLFFAMPLHTYKDFFGLRWLLIVSKLTTTLGQVWFASVRYDICHMLRSSDDKTWRRIIVFFQLGIFPMCEAKFLCGHTVKVLLISSSEEYEHLNLIVDYAMNCIYIIHRPWGSFAHNKSHLYMCVCVLGI